MHGKKTMDKPQLHKLKNPNKQKLNHFDSSKEKKEDILRSRMTNTPKQTDSA